MAARKTRRPHDAVLDAPTSPPEREAAVPKMDAERKSRIPRRAFPLALTVFAAWLLALAALALTSANPVTLNRRQILQADVVVEAVVTDQAAGECQVVRSWPAGAVGETVTVPELAHLPLKARTAYLIPLTAAEAEAHQIVRTAPPGSAALTYPATDASRRQLEALRGR